ncbi:MAG: hypothetical protein FWD17_16425 [Polyangiaceae bacterium]|nr:hypothetical protein [Polyangiaceae bacterium]
MYVRLNPPACTITVVSPAFSADVGHGAAPASAPPPLDEPELVLAADVDTEVDMPDVEPDVLDPAGDAFDTVADERDTERLDPEPPPTSLETEPTDADAAVDAGDARALAPSLGGPDAPGAPVDPHDSVARAAASPMRARDTRFVCIGMGLASSQCPSAAAVSQSANRRMRSV